MEREEFDRIVAVLQEHGIQWVWILQERNERWAWCFGEVIRGEIEIQAVSPYNSRFQGYENKADCLMRVLGMPFTDWEERNTVILDGNGHLCWVYGDQVIDGLEDGWPRNE